MRSPVIDMFESMSQVIYSHKRVFFHVIYGLQIKQFDDKAFLTLDLKIFQNSFIITFYVLNIHFIASYFLMYVQYTTITIIIAAIL